MIGDLRDLTGRDQGAHRDETSVPWRESRSKPEIAEQDVGRVLDKTGRDLSELMEQ
jgi:hypothetical protein